jgi:hypothetical protein
MISISIPLGAILFLVIYRKTLYGRAADPSTRNVQS